MAAPTRLGLATLLVLVAALSSEAARAGGRDWRRMASPVPAVVRPGADAAGAADGAISAAANAGDGGTGAAATAAGVVAKATGGADAAAKGALKVDKPDLSELNKIKKLERHGTPTPTHEAGGALQPFKIANEGNSYLLPDNFKMTTAPSPLSNVRVAARVMNPEVDDILAGKMGITDPLHDRILVIDKDYDPLKSKQMQEPELVKPTAEELREPPPVILPDTVIKNIADEEVTSGPPPPPATPAQDEAAQGVPPPPNP